MVPNTNLNDFVVDVKLVGCNFVNFDHHFMISTFGIENGPCFIRSLNFEGCSELQSIYFDGDVSGIQNSFQQNYNSQPPIHIHIAVCNALHYLNIGHMPSNLIISKFDYDITSSEIQIALDPTLPLTEIALLHNPKLRDPFNGESPFMIQPFGSSPSVFCNYAQFLTYLNVVSSGHFITFPPPPCLLTAIQSHQLQVLGYANPNTPVVCFIRDTQILTPFGYVPIQTLKEDDTILTHDGRGVPIVHMKRFVVLNNKRTNSTDIPCVIAKHSLGEETPFDDLLVSPHHAIYHPVYHKFVHASSIGKKIEQVNQEPDYFAYYHFSLPHYLTDFPIANGIITESWLEEQQQSPMTLKLKSCPFSLLANMKTLDLLNTSLTETTLLQLSQFLNAKQKQKQTQRLSILYPSKKYPELKQIDCYHEAEDVSIY